MDKSLLRKKGAGSQAQPSTSTYAPEIDRGSDTIGDKLLNGHDIQLYEQIPERSLGKRSSLFGSHLPSWEENGFFCSGDLSKPCKT